MPRGKRIATSELITQMEEKIASKEEDLAALKGTLKDLRKRRKREMAQELVQAVESQGISIEDALNKIMG